LKTLNEVTPYSHSCSLKLCPLCSMTKKAVPGAADRALPALFCNKKGGS